MLDGATQSQAINALAPGAQADALAYAPVDDSQKKPEQDDLLKSPELKKFLNDVADFAESQAESPEHWERRQQTVKLRKTLLGEYFGIFDRSRGWVSGRDEGDGIYFDPTIPTFLDDLLSKLVKSQPKLVCKPRNTELIDKREAARVAEKLLEMDDALNFTPKRQQREWKTNLLCGGETYRITYFDPASAGAGFDKEVHEPLEIQGGDEAHYCALCDGTSVSDNGTCATCGNPQVDSVVAQATTVMVSKGTQYTQIGDVDYDVPDCLEMTVIGETDDVSGALVVMRERLMPRCVLEAAFGQKIDAETEIPDRLRYKQFFTSMDERHGKAKMPQFDLLHFEEFWVAPAVYATQKLPQDTKLKGGDVAPAGAEYRKAFPDGMYYSRIKKDIFNLYPQCAAECLSHTVNSTGEGFHGRGEWDLNELGDQLTEAKSMKMNSMLQDSTQPLLVREGVVDPNNFENKFGLVIPISEDFKDRKIDDLMRRVPANALPTQAYELGEELKGQAQQRAGAFSTQSDAPDIKAMGTATGVNAITANSLGRRGPALQLYGQMFVDQGYQKLELRQRHWPKKMYASIATELGEDAVKWFMSANIKQDIIITVVPGSWMPSLEEEDKQNMQSFLALFGQLLAAKGDMDLINDIVRKGMQVFNTGLDIGDYEKESVEAQLRLDKLRDVANFVETQFGQFLYDPATDQIAPDALTLTYQQTAELLKIKSLPADATDIFAELPLDVMFDQHKEFEEAYSDWLRTAEGRAASEFVRLLVRQLADYHQQAEAFRQRRMSQYQQVTMEPELQSNVVQNEVAHQQQLAHGQQDAAAAQAAAPAQPGPMQKVAESINYKDAPPTVRRFMESQIGAPPATPQETQNEIANMAPKTDAASNGPAEMRMTPATPSSKGEN